MLQEATCVTDTRFEPREVATVVDHRRTSRGSWSGRRRFLRWWADAGIVAAVCLAQLARLWQTGADFLTVIAPGLWLAAFVVVKFASRLEFHRGWYRGVADSQQIGQSSKEAGPNCDLLEAIDDGDRTPEPWHAPGTVHGKRAKYGGSAS
jgi:hypothetical protein